MIGRQSWYGVRIAAAAWVQRQGFRLSRWSRRLEPRRERERKDLALATKLLTMVQVKRLSDADLVVALHRLCDPLPVGSRTSETLLEAAERLERYGEARAAPDLGRDMKSKQ